MKIPVVRTPFSRELTALIVVLMVLAGSAFGKSKDDVVVMKNGDRLTGEIKGLEHGVLSFKAAYMVDSVQLDWDRVERLESKDTFVVGLNTGIRVTGGIAKVAATSDSDKDFKIVEASSTIVVKPTEVVGIQQHETNFWDQLTGSINYGFSFSSGNSSTNSSLGANVGYATEKNGIQLASTQQFDSQSGGKNTNRFTFDSQYARTITGKWIAAGLFSLLKSNQQDLDLRSTYGGGMGRRLIQTGKTTLTTLGGAVYTHESYSTQTSAVPTYNNAEGLAGLNFSTYRFKTLGITSQLLIFPSISDPGRVRLSSQSGVQIEIVRNLYWNFGLYDNVDSRPPVAAPKNDLGITTSLGWKF